MAISVTGVQLYRTQFQDGRPWRSFRLTVSGLTTNADNTIPHGIAQLSNPGLGAVTFGLKLVPDSAALWGQQPPPDAANVYVHVGAGGATSGPIYAYA